MKSKFKYFLPFFLVLILANFTVFSATLQITRIGALNTEGMTYTEWWYTGVNPTFAGKAAANSEVTLRANDTNFTTTANSSGDWSIATQLSAADYTIITSQGSESLTWTVHLGQSLPSGVSSTGEASQSTTAVPVTGFNQMVALSFGVGVSLLATYLYISSDVNKKAAFERRIIKED